MPLENGDWRCDRSAAKASHDAKVLAWSDEELHALSCIDEQLHRRLPQTSLADEEMRCQRDMRVRGVRLRAYHERLGDLADIMGIAA